MKLPRNNLQQKLTAIKSRLKKKRDLITVIEGCFKIY